MARPLRLQFPGACYHVTARGNRRAPICRDDADRARFLDFLGREAMQQGWRLYAYCLMDNHYHLLIETPEGNLSRGMQRINSAYSQAFNRHHALTGHLFQGRYKAILVDRDAYLRELCRYLVLNPVRAGLVERAEDWPWSSHRAVLGLSAAPTWLDAEAVLGLFGTRPKEARGVYTAFVAQGVDQPSPWDRLKGQIYLGRDSFLDEMQRLAASQAEAEIPLAQRAPARPDREEILRAVARAYGIPPGSVLDRANGPAFKAAVYLLRRMGNLPLRAVAGLSGVSPARISQIQAEIERGPGDERVAGLMAGYKVKT